MTPASTPGSAPHPSTPEPTTPEPTTAEPTTAEPTTAEPTAEESATAGSATDPVATWQQELRARGYRMTPQRQLVLEAVTELGHATPDEILAAVQRKARGVNVSTIYRTLDLLEEFGLVTHAHIGHGAPTYHPGHAPAHAHLVCRNCQSVTEVRPEVIAPLVEALEERYGFTTDVRHLTVQGRCADCGPADAAE